MDRTLIDLNTILKENDLTTGLGSNYNQLLNIGQSRVLNLWKNFYTFCSERLEELEKQSNNDTEISQEQQDHLITKFTDLAHVLSYLSYLKSNYYEVSAISNANPYFEDSDWEYDYSGDCGDFVNEYWNKF